MYVCKQPQSEEQNSSHIHTVCLLLQYNPVPMFITATATMRFFFKKRMIQNINIEYKYHDFIIEYVLL